MNAAIMVPAWCADAWVMHQVFRKLGFTADEIYFDCHDTLDAGPQCALVSVERDGKTFSFNLGHVETGREETQQIWANYIVYMNAAPEAEHQAMWDASTLQRTLPRTELILRMVEKGFDLPGFTAESAELLRTARAARPRSGS